MELTNSRGAGLLLGVWELGFQLGRAMANLIGAGLFDLMREMTPLLAYCTAFAAGSGLLLAARRAFGRLNTRSAQMPR